MSSNVETLSGALARLNAQGYVDDFRAENGKLRAVKSGNTYLPAELHIEETVRFEGETDLDDEVIVFALSDKKFGIRGTYTTAFSTHMDGHDIDIVHQLK